MIVMVRDVMAAVGRRCRFSVGPGRGGRSGFPLSVTGSGSPLRQDTGFGRFPSRVFAINQAWLQLALTGIDLLARTQTPRPQGDPAHAEPKKLRYRLLHVPARIARRTWPRIADDWPWADEVITAFARLTAFL